MCQLTSAAPCSRLRCILSHSLQVEVIWKQMLGCSVRCKMSTTEQPPWKEQEEVDSGRERCWRRCSPPRTSAILAGCGAVNCAQGSCPVLSWWLRFDIVHNIFPVVSCELWVCEWSVTPSKTAHCSWGGPGRSWCLEAGLPFALLQVWARKPPLTGTWVVHPYIHNTPPSYNFLLFSYAQD